MKVTEVERKESTKHCCGNGWTQKNRAEHEGYAGALIGKRIAENNTTNADRGVNGLLERIVEAGNLNRAYKRVRRNKGAGGVDGMKVDELLLWRNKEDVNHMTKKKVKTTQEQLEKENELLRQQNLKLIIENEYLKKLNALVQQRETQVKKK